MNEWSLEEGVRPAGTARHRLGVSRLLADAKSLDEIRVSLEVLALDVVQEASPLTDEHQEPAA